jgi:hypothetical protein
LDTDDGQRGDGANAHVDAAAPILDTDLYSGNGDGDDLRRRCRR